MGALLRQRPPGKHRQSPPAGPDSASIAFLISLSAEMAAAPMPELDMPAGQPWPGSDGA